MCAIVSCAGIASQVRLAHGTRGHQRISPATGHFLHIEQTASVAETVLGSIASSAD